MNFIQIFFYSIVLFNSFILFCPDNEQQFPYTTHISHAQKTDTEVIIHVLLPADLHQANNNFKLMPRNREAFIEFRKNQNTRSFGVEIYHNNDRRHQFFTLTKSLPPIDVQNPTFIHKVDSRVLVIKFPRIID